jgi:predicted nucleic acid-binding protein
MTAYLLDTSAVLAHVYREPGHAQVQRLLEEQAATVLLAAPSLLEMETALKRKMTDAGRRRTVVRLYGGELAEVVSVDREAAMTAIEISAVSAKRLPALDALIAGCAVANDAVLVHRDPHFDAIPPERLRALRLPDTSEPPTSADVPKVVKEDGAQYKASQRKRRKRP